jgi:hypothetical protein
MEELIAQLEQDMKTLERGRDAAKEQFNRLDASINTTNQIITAMRFALSPVNADDVLAAPPIEE